jgi:D-3-phosphoglycerate dehydrogenase
VAQHKIAFIARAQPDTELVEHQLSGLDYEMEVHVPESQGETVEAIKGADVIINMGVPMPRAVIEGIDRAQAIVSQGHGFDRIDHDAATGQNVMVVNCAGYCTEEVSNHTIMGVLACAKSLTIFNDMVKSGGWTAQTRTHLPWMAPVDGQTLGLIGFGNIARATARKAKVFGLEVIAQDPYVQPWIAKEYRVALVRSLEELAQRSDFVSIHVPLNDETRKLVGETFFKAMKPTAYFINTCRGPTVDEAALVHALQSGEIAGAAIDVFEQEPTPADNPLFALDNVILTPHTAGYSNVSRPAAQVRLGQEAARILKGEWPMSLVNPEVRASIPVRGMALNV